MARSIPSFFHDPDWRSPACPLMNEVTTTMPAGHSGVPPRCCPLQESSQPVNFAILHAEHRQAHLCTAAWVHVLGVRDLLACPLQEGLLVGCPICLCLGLHFIQSQTKGCLSHSKGSKIAWACVSSSHKPRDAQATAKGLKSPEFDEALCLLNHEKPFWGLSAM